MGKFDSPPSDYWMLSDERTFEWESDLGNFVFGGLDDKSWVWNSNLHLFLCMGEFDFYSN